MILQQDLKNSPGLTPTPESRGRKLAVRGFTLAELLIVIAIVLVLAAIVAPIYGNLQGSSQLQDGSSQIIQNFRVVRERSAARLNDQEHGIYLQSDRYVVYQGPSFISRNADYDRVVILDNALTLSWLLTGLGGPGDVNFARGLGSPNKTGTITFTHAVRGAKVIRINNLGMVEAD